MPFYVFKNRKGDVRAFDVPRYWRISRWEKLICKFLPARDWHDGQEWIKAKTFRGRLYATSPLPQESGPGSTSGRSPFSGPAAG